MTEQQTQTDQPTTTGTASPADAGANPAAPADGVGQQGGGSPAAPATPEQVEGVEPVKKERVGLTLAQVMERDRVLKKREKELDEREKGFEGQKGYLERLKEDPLAVLNEAGLDFRKVVEIGLNGKKDPTTEEKLAALESQIEADKQARADEKKTEAQKMYERQVQQHMDAISANIKRADDEGGHPYELLGVWDGGPELVNEVMVAYHKEHGKVLTYDEACQMTETGLHEQITGKLLGTIKIKKYLEEQAAAAAGKSVGDADKEKGASKQKTLDDGKAKGPRTLTNAHESVVVHKIGSQTDEERLARAVKALEGGGTAA